ncbi:uncharacterized protein LOC134835528 [Culicoides brevitarsis]|uniref:uncharacterized protein LOC134835528 n=1 Tax=Culicoides brevitarsis TaxID=469753 RepID=UPI00307B9FDA
MLAFNLFLCLWLSRPIFCDTEGISNSEEKTLIDTNFDILPPGMILCSRNSSNSVRSDCIKDSINHLIPQLKNGFPPLDFPILDPFLVNRTYIEYEQNFLKAKLNVTEALVRGVSTGEVKMVKSKLNSTHFYVLFDLHVPVIQIEADFEGRTLFNDLVVQSEGHAVIDCFKVIATFKFNGVLQTLDDGEDYMIVKSANFTKVVMEEMKLNGTGLLPEPELNEVVVQILNEIWEMLLQNIFPRFKASWDPIIVDLLNCFFEKVPFNMLMEN